MTNRTWNRRSSAVSTHAKSVATIALAWERMNSDQDGPVRSRVGSMPAARRIFHTVDAATLWPRRRSSPWIAAVAPGRVLAGQSDDQSPEFGVDGWPSGCGGGWLGPVAGDESAVPSQHGLGANDQERGALAGTVHRRGENSEDRPVGVGELRSADLALQHEDLVAEGEDLGVAGIAGGEHPPESGQNEASQSGEEGHERRTLSTGPTLETPEIAGRMSIRPPQANSTPMTRHVGSTGRVTHRSFAVEVVGSQSRLGCDERFDLLDDGHDVASAGCGVGGWG